jgi:RNA polymerase sigma-70 factor (ECF subfamily)
VSDSDASLVARVVGDDDRTAFELLVRRHQSPLRNFLRRLANNDWARADDLAQDTFMKAYNALATYAGSAQFSTWLYRIAYNTFLNDQRKRHPATEFDEAEHSPPAAAEDRGAESDVWSAVARLPTRQQAVFYLHYRKDLSHSEVAITLGVPLGTVKSDLSRGHATLKRDLDDWRPQ